MKTPDEIRAACKAYQWFRESGRIGRQLEMVQLATLGAIAALEWCCDDITVATNPIAGSLVDIAAMQRKAGN